MTAIRLAIARWITPKGWRVVQKPQKVDWIDLSNTAVVWSSSSTGAWDGDG
jgi:hypothetical protein